jgi:hypothetical protein
MTGLDCRTYKGSAGAGNRIVLATRASVMALCAQGTAIFWVRPNAKGQVLGGIPVATPAPGANATADGWIRVSATDPPPNAGANDVPFPPGQEITSLDIWCEADGYLVVLAGRAFPRLSRIV